MFEAVPARYDLLNRVLTLGLDQRWRRRAAARMLERSPRRVLDLGTGTGDLALLLAARAGACQVVAADFSSAMLAVAGRKALEAGRHDHIRFLCADAVALPLPSEAFDAVGIAFAFRNLSYKNPSTHRALAELHRVITPGGRLVVVETSQPSIAVLRGAYHSYLRAVVGPLGGRLSGQGGAYRYLATSARHFHTAEAVSDLLASAGFEVVAHEPLLFGVAAIHIGVRGQARERGSR
jgi:demethylmenaquinone methyltransferase / 2-methoxy-6-polyprenyl-1,4-benzoquinol methylase